jgi:hypothetical protein
MVLIESDVSIYFHSFPPQTPGIHKSGHHVSVCVYVCVCLSVSVEDLYFVQDSHTLPWHFSQLEAKVCIKI